MRQEMGEPRSKSSETGEMKMSTKKLLTAEEVAEALEVRPSTVRLWARRGWIPTIRLTSKVVRYELNAIDARRNSKRPGKKHGQ